MTKLTVMMPCYNAAPYLPETLRSLKEQDVEFQLVVVDDKSTDKSMDVLCSHWPQAVVVEGESAPVTPAPLSPVGRRGPRRTQSAPRTAQEVP